MQQQLIEIASWRIISELQNLYPDRFFVIETHPGGGLYDCLSIHESATEECVAHLNRAGSFMTTNGRHLGKVWKDMMNSSDPAPIVEAMRVRMGWRRIHDTPPPTPFSVIYDFIATFLMHATFGACRWECRNGFHDTTGYGSGVRSDFLHFPEVQHRLLKQGDHGMNGQPAYGYWFVRRNGDPRMCIDQDGTVWIRGTDASTRVWDMYQDRGEHMWSTVISIAGSLMS